MPTPLSQIERKATGNLNDWAYEFRRTARKYERALRRIRNATACDAWHLREFAGKALLVKPKKAALQEGEKK